MVTRGHRPMPEDGMPVVGFCTSSCSTRSPSLYVVVCHSGVTLGPMLGIINNRNDNDNDNDRDRDDVVIVIIRIIINQQQQINK
jgi:hypothetical protein